VSDEGEYRLWSLLGALQDDGLNPDRLPSAPAHLRRDSNAFFLPIASYAQIPAANTQVFLSQVDAWEKQFIFVSKLDAGRRQFKAAINEVKTTIKRLGRALEYLDKLQYGSFMLDRNFEHRLYHEWPDLLECMHAFHRDKISQPVCNAVLKTLPPKPTSKL
jgi:hypothetical protein